MHTINYQFVFSSLDEEQAKIKCEERNICDMKIGMTRDVQLQYSWKHNFGGDFTPPWKRWERKTFPYILSELQFTFHVWLYENNMLMFVKRFPLNVMYYRHVIIITKRWWASWNWQFMHVAKTEETSWLEFLYFRGVFLLQSTMCVARFCVNLNKSAAINLRESIFSL